MKTIIVTVVVSFFIVAPMIFGYPPFTLPGSHYNLITGHVVQLGQ